MHIKNYLQDENIFSFALYRCILLTCTIFKYSVREWKFIWIMSLFFSILLVLPKLNMKHVIACQWFNLMIARLHKSHYLATANVSVGCLKVNMLLCALFKGTCLQNCFIWKTKEGGWLTSNAHHTRLIHFLTNPVAHWGGGWQWCSWLFNLLQNTVQLWVSRHIW